MLVENNSLMTDIRVRQEAFTLHRSGYLVSVICPRLPDHPWFEVVNGIHVFSYPQPVSGSGLTSYLFEYGYSLCAMLFLSLVVFIKHGFFVIHSANPPDSAVMIALFYKLFGKKFIFDHHDLAPELYQIRFGAQKKAHRLVLNILLFLEKLSCKYADHIIATNWSYKRIEVERDNVSADKITVVRNGPNMELMQPVEPLANLARPGKTTLLYLGVLGFQDGVDYLLRSLKLLAFTLERKDFFCLIAGDGAALPELMMQAQEYKLDDYLTFVGWVASEQVANFIASADICIASEPSNPLNNSSTIVKIMEYMAVGKPTVAFDLPEHRVTAQEAAIYANPNDELDFAHKIQFLMDNPEKRKKMGKAGLQRIEKELAWKHQEIHLLKAYQSLLEKKPE